VTHSVLFVCTGNICRSPTAEGLFAAYSQEAGCEQRWRCDSAGIYAQAGLAPQAQSIEVAATYGADISQLRSRAVCGEDFSNFDRIIALDCGHLDYLSAVAPASYLGQITLFESPLGNRIEVDDPYGLPNKAYERAAADIAAGVRCLLEQLQTESR
jgi:protein-tyrosine phosphatase